MEIVTQQQSLQQQQQQHQPHHNLGHHQSGSSQRHVGLLQIAPVNSGRGGLTNTTLTASSSSMGGITAVSSMGGMTAVSSSSMGSAAPTLGIPTPNLTGVLTGIKPPPLFSLPGARGAEPRGGAFRHQQDKAEEEKPVSYVLGG